MPFGKRRLGGGSQINALFMERGLVDEISLTVEPLIFGLGVDLFRGLQFDVRAKLLPAWNRYTGLALMPAGSSNTPFSLNE